MLQLDSMLNQKMSTLEYQVTRREIAALLLMFSHIDALSQTLILGKLSLTQAFNKQLQLLQSGSLHLGCHAQTWWRLGTEFIATGHLKHLFPAPYGDQWLKDLSVFVQIRGYTSMPVSLRMLREFYEYRAQETLKIGILPGPYVSKQKVKSTRSTTTHDYWNHTQRKKQYWK